MSRWIDQAEMTADDIVKCCVQAAAIIRLCERAAWENLQNGSPKEVQLVADDMQFALQLAADLLGPVQDALQVHEGFGGGCK